MEENSKRTFGMFLAEKRKAQGLTMRDLADKLGCTAPFLSDVEKDRRNALKPESLEKLIQIFSLTQDEKDEMYDLAGKTRETIAPDLPEYIMSHQSVAFALRTARDLNVGDDAWEKFVEELKKRKGE